MHWVPYKSLQDAEKLKAVAPLSSAMQTAQFACNCGNKVALIHMKLYRIYTNLILAFLFSLKTNGCNHYLDLNSTEHQQNTNFEA